MTKFAIHFLILITILVVFWLVTVLTGYTPTYKLGNIL